MVRLISSIAVFLPASALAQAEDAAAPLPSPSVIGLVIAGAVAVGVIKLMRRK